MWVSSGSSASIRSFAATSGRRSRQGASGRCRGAADSAWTSEEGVMTAKSFAAVTLVLLVTVPCVVAAQQANGDVWRTFAQKLETGTELTVRLENGQHFSATLIEARSDALVLQPRTRRPVPLQPVSYDAILSLERHNRHGMGAAKAAGIGVAVGVGVFFAILAILAATLD